MNTATLQKKTLLTSDVYELCYTLEEPKTMKPGQFVTFILPRIGGRSYSVLKLYDNVMILIIKRWPLDGQGRGGSIALCDAEEGETFKIVGPAGHFTLRETEQNKLFLGTGTGLVPLYNMIIHGLEKKTSEKYQLVFGVRTHKDSFYIKKFVHLKEKYPDRFYFHLTVSRDEPKGVIKKGYVTDFLSEKVVSDYGEFYICGAPAMIESCQEKLLEFGANKDQIYFEKYS